MDFVLDGLILLILGVIVYQDFKYRGIFWGVIPALLILFVIQDLVVMDMTFNALMEHTIVNLAFVAVQLLGVWIYFSLKQRQMVKLIDQQIGLGDVLFFVALAVAFAPVNYVLFFIVSFMATILGYGGLMLVNKNTDPHIPLAGSMAVVLMLAIGLKMVGVMQTLQEPINLSTWIG